MKAKSIFLAAAVTLGAFVLPSPTAEAGYHRYRNDRYGPRVVVVYPSASRWSYRPYRTYRSYYGEPVYYRRPYYYRPGISVRVGVGLW